MRFLFLCALPIVLLSGCASWPEGSEDIDLPAATPFDNNPAQRAAYLDAYHQGYRAGKHEGRTSNDFIRGPHHFAQELGWRAGASQAVANSTEEDRPTGKK